MKMDRRDFLKWTAAAGMVATAPRWMPTARAATEAWQGPYWLTIHAAGGWDPTLLCDPKGRANENTPDPVNHYFTDDIVEVGPFRAAPVSGHRTFLERFRDDLLVINGIDAQTNSHETGTRYTWSGSMDPGYPALPALVAAAEPARPSLAYVSHGGYDITDGLVAPTRLPDTSAILQIAYPERLDEDEPDSTLLPESMLARLRSARDARLQRQIDAATLPRVKRAMSVLQQARTGDNELAALAESLPATLDGSNNPLRRQAQVSIACFKAGVSMSASLSMGGFDTHGNHDDSHTPNLQRIVEAVTYAMDEAERAGIADKLIIVVGSDFARTPWYNDTNGKDHWSITSMMMMGPGIRGGRVIGATDERQVPVGLDAGTLRTVSSGGIRITPADVHASLRQLAGIDGKDPASRYPVGSLLPILG
ncbi:MAG: DUF1501 domain-containing protein [Alphaproteobacteria bacterium]|nr:DUF1501 domain-containing protein [Alphaproteobacteria bacterium]